MSSQKILIMIRSFLQDIYPPEAAEINEGDGEELGIVISAGDLEVLILDCVNSIEDQLQEESSLMEERNSTDTLH